jgi:hypothetical protein
MMGSPVVEPRTGLPGTGVAIDHSVRAQCDNPAGMFTRT